MLAQVRDLSKVQSISLISENIQFLAKVHVIKPYAREVASLKLLIWTLIR